METAIRWSVKSSVEKQRFLLADVTGRSFRHCKVESYDGKNIQYDTISVNRNVPAFRAFDWSPVNENILGVGEWSGSASVLRLDDEQSSPLSLPAKSQRPVNAVAFAKTALLVVGLERVRNDTSLNIWDIQHRLLASTSSHLPSPRNTSLDPIRRYASSEGITSIKVFCDQPDVILAGVKGACIRIYDLRENTGNPIIQWPTTSIHNIAIDPLDENFFASSGTQKDTTIHIWDRRAGPASSAVSLGSNSGSGHNAQSGPVLEYRRAFEASTPSAQPQIWSLRYCRGQRGYLGALASNGDLRVFETKHAHTSGVNEHEQSSWANNSQASIRTSLRTERIHHIVPALKNQKYRQEDTPRIVAFDFTNLAGPKGRPCAFTVRSDQRIEVHELQGRPAVFALSSKGQLIGSGMVSTLQSKASTQDDIFAQSGLYNMQPSLNQHPLQSMDASEPADRSTILNGNGVHKEHSTVEETAPLSSREKHEQWFEDRYLHQIPSVEKALASLNLSRRRCAQGYLFDCRKNMDLVAEDPWLQDMWAWIDRAKQLAIEGSLVVRGIDLSYLGVYNIWNVDLGIKTETVCVGSEKSVRISGMSDNPDISYAVEAICRSLELPELTSTESSLPAHRRLCLHICGFGFSSDELNATTETLTSQGRHTKAAALALAHGDPKQALAALRSGSTSTHRELSLALAGYLAGTADEDWTSTIASIAISIPSTDPYALAVLAYVRTGSWPSILSETYLPLYYRIGIALLHLPDADLTTYITTLTNECIHHGDIEGLPLTGLSSQAVPLLQAYLLKYHDLQSAILAISHTSPRYFPSPLVDLWRAEYRSLLNAHRLFIPRVRFDVGATKLSATSSSPTNNNNHSTTTGKPALAPPAKQVSLKCNNCDQSLDRNPAHISTFAPPVPPSSTTTTTTHPTTGSSSSSIFADHKSGTVCPKCGKHMPRCVICMLWLGMPDPHTKGGAQANAQAMQRNREDGGAGKRAKELMKDMVSVCRGCWHMMHVGHVEEWFAANRECPVPGCECRCADGGDAVMRV
ncbi:MAG: hypothetical protein Q9208_003871 [Pyrenodesmia sp. 3 TL-2023]